MKIWRGSPPSLTEFLTLAGIIALGMWGCPQYDVWQQGLAGQAELPRAVQNRKIRIQEAQAKLDSAGMEAEAEIARAQGVAEANEILQNQLGGPENYLRYRYILMLEETGRGENREVIYVPTEAQLPILEATRLER